MRSLTALAALSATAVVLVLAAAADGTLGGSQSRAETTKATVGVWLKEWRVISSAKTVPAGKVTFVVSNIGTLEHELVVIRSTRAPDALPTTGKKAREVGSRGEVEELQPSQANHLTTTMPAGRYILICNLGDHGGHYKRGMFASLTVR
jgi:uncharacterized cupredoxin-like copper-binding protein